MTESGARRRYNVPGVPSPRAKFVIVSETDFPDMTPLVIRDVGHATGCPSVTNDAEAVVHFLVLQGRLSRCGKCGRNWTPSASACRDDYGEDSCDGAPIEKELRYYDSEGDLSILHVARGRFAGFRPVKKSGPELCSSK